MPERGSALGGRHGRTVRQPSAGLGLQPDDRAWKDEYAARALIEATFGADDLTTALLDAVEANPEVREDVAVLSRSLFCPDSVGTI